MADAIARISLPDQVFHRLVADVLAGRHAPGDRLPTQRALAAELGVNMASVREGVKRLEQLGLVEVRHGDAMRVRDWRLHGGPDVLVHLIARDGALDVEMVRAVMEARRLLLAESARLAAELGVNMASVREGVKRLEQLGLVEVRHGDAMRVRDWRLHGGPDVLVHLIAREGALDVEMVRAVMEARRLLLAESARLAAERRSDDQAALLAALAAQLEDAPDDEAAQHLDFAWYAVLIEAAGNVVFLLVMNSMRAIYLDHLELFRPIVADRAALLPRYRAAARAILERDGDAAAAEVARLAVEQESRLLAALG